MLTGLKWLVAIAVWHLPLYAQAGGEKARVSITSEPALADITIDGVYSGKTPSAFSLDPGQHTFVLSKRGFAAWPKSLTVLPRSMITLRAEMATEKAGGAPPGGVRPGRPAIESGIYPAVSFGENRWTSVRLHNPTSARQQAIVEGFRWTGTTMGPEVLVLGPGERKEVRIQPSSGKPEICWVRVDHASTVNVEVSVEILKGNRLEYFNRERSPVQNEARWVNPTESVQDKYLYYLNLSDVETVVGFCAAQGPGDSCKNSRPHYRVPANGSILVPVKRIDRTYTIVESSGSRQSVVLYVYVGEGGMKEFGAESSVNFGEIAAK